MDVALGGANLIELTMLERVGLADRKSVVVYDQSSTGDPILDRALGVIGARQGKKPKAVVEALGKNLRNAPRRSPGVARPQVRAQDRRP